MNRITPLRLGDREYAAEKHDDGTVIVTDVTDGTGVTPTRQDELAAADAAEDRWGQ